MNCSWLSCCTHSSSILVDQEFDGPFLDKNTKNIEKKVRFAATSDFVTPDSSQISPSPSNLNEIENSTCSLESSQVLYTDVAIFDQNEAASKVKKVETMFEISNPRARKDTTKSRKVRFSPY